MILRLGLNKMVLQSSEHELSLRQREPNGSRRIFVNRRAATNLVNADGPIRPDYLHDDPPLHPAPRFPDQADRSTPTFWTVSSRRPAPEIHPGAARGNPQHARRGTARRGSREIVPGPSSDPPAQRRVTSGNRCLRMGRSGYVRIFGQK
jgi:hypothetical protein